MSSNTDIIALLSTEADKAVDQIIIDSKRLHLVVNGTGTEQAVTEDGSLIPSIRKAFLDNLYFKTPPLPWKNGSSVTEFNQLYSFTDVSGNTTWWYAPGATVSSPVVMRDSPINDGKFKVFLDKSNIADIYAPIVSPNFKGNPRVPSPAPGDNSSTIPTTGWVQREMQELKDLIISSTQGEFENITVRKDSVLNNLYVSGEFIVNSDKLSAPTTEATFRRIRIVGIGQGAATEIAFEQNGTPPVGVKTKTNLRPYTVSTGTLTADEATLGKVKMGDVAVANDSLDVDGYMRGDYLHLEGNNRNSADRPQLIVDGIAEIGTLRVTDKIEGVKADVDGLDIHPRSVAVDEGLTVGKDTALTGKLNVTGDTKVKNLDVSGTLTGVAISVDGKDINPRSVKTGNLIATGDVQISGTTTATGKIVTQDLEVLGTLTANLDLSGSDLSVDNINVAKTATIKDLVVTGTTTGVTADVEGKPIKPLSVETGVIKGSTLTTTGAATIGGNLSVTGDFRPASIDTGAIEADSLVVNGNITQSTGTTKVVNLEVTGTTTGVTADVTGKDILPKSVVTTGKVSVGGNADVGGTLSVTGKTTLGDVDFTGTVTGLDIDLSQKNITVKSIGATDPSAFGDVATDNITNGEKITTKDIQVTGQILDADGNPINTFDVTGKDILPNSVQSATSVKTKTLEVEQTSLMKGALELRNGLTVTLGDITAPQGKATFNDVQVNGALTDASGNAIGSVESIKGKNIEPRSVVADVSVQAPSVQSTGELLGDSLAVTNHSALNTLTVTGLTNAGEVRLSGPLTGTEATVEGLTIKRRAGTDNLRFNLEGDGDIQGSLNVSGTITGAVDLSAQNIVMKNLQTTEDTRVRNLTASATVTGSNGVFGGGSSPGAIGLQSLSDAKVEEDLVVGGDLRVGGSISGDLNLSGKEINPAKVTATDVVGTNGNFTNLTVTGTLNVPEQPVNIKDLTCDSVSTGSISASKMSVVPKSDTVATAAYTPDGTASVYNVNITADTEIKAPAGLLTGGKAETFFLYVTQDGTGHPVTFSGDFFVHGAKVVNPAADALTICNMVYRGIGNVIDVFIAERA